MKYRVYSSDKNRVIADGEGTIVMYDYVRNEKVYKMADHLREAIEAVEEGESKYY